MKKHVLLIMLVAFLGMQLSAATPAKKKSKKSDTELRFGARVGLNIANMSIKDADPSPTSIMGFHLGGMVEYGLADNMALEAGLLYSGKGFKMEFSDVQSIMGYEIKSTGKSTVKPAYLEVPINFLYKLPMGDNTLFFYAGPYLGFAMGGKIKSEATVTSTMPGIPSSSSSSDDKIKYGSDTDSDMKGMDFGLNIGAGFEFSTFQVRAQYGLGLSNLAPADPGEMKNKVIGISFGYLFAK